MKKELTPVDVMEALERIAKESGIHDPDMNGINAFIVGYVSGMLARVANGDMQAAAVRKRLDL